MGRGCKAGSWQLPICCTLFPGKAALWKTASLASSALSLAHTALHTSPHTSHFHTLHFTLQFTFHSSPHPKTWPHTSYLTHLHTSYLIFHTSPKHSLLKPCLTLHTSTQTSSQPSPYHLHFNFPYLTHNLTALPTSSFTCSHPNQLQLLCTDIPGTKYWVCLVQRCWAKIFFLLTIALKKIIK